jgi:hypothetical protein
VLDVFLSLHVPVYIPTNVALLLVYNYFFPFLYLYRQRVFVKEKAQCVCFHTLFHVAGTLLV